MNAASSKGGSGPAAPITGQKAREIALQAGDDGTNDMLVSDVIRPNELQVWFLAEHLVDVPPVRASDPS